MPTLTGWAFKDIILPGRLSTVQFSALRSLSVSSCYREIFSYIKGSREAIGTHGHLTRAEYVAMASKMSPLPPAMRDAAYDVFEEGLELIA